MPTIQPQDFYVSDDKNLYSYLALDAYIAVFDKNFDLKYSTYFGNGGLSDGTSSISFSEFDNRLFFAGNTHTNNGLNTLPTNYLFLEEYDNTSSNDFFLGNLVGSTTSMMQTTWFAMFELDGLEIPGTGSSSITEIDRNIKLFPNPTDQILILETNDTEFTLSLYDLSGKTIFQNQYKNNKVEIDLNNCSSGTYLIKYQSNTNIFDKLIIKL